MKIEVIPTRNNIREVNTRETGMKTSADVLMKNVKNTQIFSNKGTIELFTLIMKVNIKDRPDLVYRVASRCEYMEVSHAALFAVATLNHQITDSVAKLL